MGLSILALCLAPGMPLCAQGGVNVHFVAEFIKPPGALMVPTAWQLVQTGLVGEALKERRKLEAGPGRTELCLDSEKEGAVL